MKLEQMNQELAKRRRRLKKHSHKKQKLTNEAVMAIQKDIQDNSLTEGNILLCDSNSSTYVSFFSTPFAMEVNDMSTPSQSAKYVPSRLINDSQDIPYHDEYISETRVQNSLSQEMLISEEASIPAGQVSVAESFQNRICTPEKVIPRESNIQSPVLTYSKSQERPFQKKIGKLLPSSQLKRRNILSAETSSVETAHVNNMQNDTATTVLCATDDTVIITEDMKPKPEDTVNSTIHGLESHTIELPKTKGQILFAFCESGYFILVQDKEINIWSLSGNGEPVCLHIGTLPREEIGRSLGCMGSSVKVGSEDLIVCMELWEAQSPSKDVETSLKCVVYSYSVSSRNLKSYHLHLRQLSG